MTPAPRTTPNILIASDDSTDAMLVHKLLSGAFNNVFVSTDGDKAVEDFDHRLPQVLVLAFNALAKAERYCLGLYRLSTKIHARPHRTVILCDKAEVKEVSELCFKQSFDDYVLFWPMNHDASRLRMAVHHALRDLARLKAAGPSVTEFAAQARQLSELETLLDQQLAMGERRMEVANLAIEQAEQDIGAALTAFSHRLGQGALPDVVEVKDAAGLDREMAGLRQQQVEPPLRAVADAMQPLKRWAAELRQECAPHLESARAMHAMAQRVPPMVLLVDDDTFQHGMVAKLLEAENVQLVFAASGAEALKLLANSRPDLILMDVQMPEMSGIETTRRLKTLPRFADVPVIMITGQSAGKVVVDSLKAGAADFLVKPLERDKLVAKLARWSRPKGLPALRASTA